MRPNEQTLNTLMEVYCRQCEKRDFNDPVEKCQMTSDCYSGAIQIYQEALKYYNGEKNDTKN